MTQHFYKGLTKGRWGRRRMAKVTGMSVGGIHKWITDGLVPNDQPGNNEAQFFLIIACAMLHQTGGCRKHMRRAWALFSDLNAPEGDWTQLALLRRGDDLEWLHESAQMEYWITVEAAQSTVPYSVLPVGRCWAEAHQNLKALTTRRASEKRSDNEHLATKEA